MCVSPHSLIFVKFIALDGQIVVLPQTHFSLWSVVIFVSLCAAVVHFICDKEPPVNEQMVATLIAFMISVFLTSTVAGELLNCLAAIGTIMEMLPANIGLTVLALGNSIGDLVADVALAKVGKPGSTCWLGWA